ncbi:glycosyltransferase family 2 protein [Desulfoluna spongiiphila]|uniref:glycosyltransferase family 2 protein n=1 Tax=Desulfoluna spongiiphila TaxID=419481 RepID=UPI0012569428|nr:glycosyltransferase family 2 protein [Desulfoluna spongiiphila]VVS95305.1 nucleotide-diphospho-sugar transferases [Desulfoluna spongiiphila]
MKHDNVFVLILNWKGINDTIQCVEGVLSLQPKSKTIVVIDNDSRDNSLLILRSHFQKRNLKMQLLNEDQISNDYSGFNTSTEIVLIQNYRNYGFAGGNNIGIIYAKKMKADYIWILNNDAIPENGSLLALLSVGKSDINIGFVGSVILYKDQNSIINCFGGARIYPLLGISKLVLKNVNINALEKIKVPEIDYISGASMLLNCNVLNDVGLMDDKYFMYSEEKDWQMRAKKKIWKVAVSKNSYVYHDKGGSTKNTRELYYYYSNRSTMIYTKKFHGLLITIVALVNLSVITIIKNLKCYKNIKYGLIGIYDGFKHNMCRYIN